MRFKVMSEVSPEQIQQFVDACHKAAGYGLVKCSSGNMSWRVADDIMLVTATKSWISDITPDQVAVCRISDGQVLNGRRPSIESGFHAGIFQNRADVNVVLHFQSPAATTIACCDPKAVNFNVILELPFYIGEVASIPFLIPGSAELASAVISAMQDHDMVMLKNHGLVTAGCDLNSTIQQAVFFELACDIILRAGDKIAPLSAETVAKLREMAKSPKASV